MKHIWVVMSGCYGDEGIVAIYSSQKKAEQALERLLKDKYGKQGEPWIEKWDVQ